MSFTRGSWFFHVFFISLIIFMLFVNYMAWFRNLGEKQYEKGKNVFPFSVIASGGKRFYVWYYKISALFVLLVLIAFYILLFLSG
jgi:hypothetical protein